MVVSEVTGGVVEAVEAVSGRVSELTSFSGVMCSGSENVSTLAC